MNNNSHNSRSDGRRYFLNSLSSSTYSDMPRPQADYEQTYRLLPIRDQATQTDSNMYPAESRSQPDEKEEDSGCSTFTYDPMSCADEASTLSDKHSVFGSDSSFVGTEEMPRLLMKSAIREAMDNLYFSRLEKDLSEEAQSSTESEELQSEAESTLSSVIKTLPNYTPHEGDYLGPGSWTLALELQDALKDLNNGVCEHLEKLGKIPHPTKKSTEQQKSMEEPSEDEQVLMYVASATDRLHQKKKLEQERMTHTQKTKFHPSRAEDLKSYFGDMKKMLAHEVIMPVQLRVVTQMKRSLEEMIYLTKALEQISTSSDIIFTEAYEMDKSSKKH